MKQKRVAFICKASISYNGTGGELGESLHKDIVVSSYFPTAIGYSIKTQANDDKQIPFTTTAEILLIGSNYDRLRKKIPVVAKPFKREIRKVLKNPSLVDCDTELCFRSSFGNTKEGDKFWRKIKRFERR